jgi:DNA helicase-2/ATP-dependent DNA helicase PcrA
VPRPDEVPARRAVQCGCNARVRADVTACVYGPRVRDVLLDDLDDRQRAAVTSDAAPLAIVAPAGSGKTRVLTRRIAFRARESRLVPRHVLAVTFTRKAAGELVSRILRLGVDGRITAGTFHAVALSQLRRHAHERNREMPRLLERKGRLLAPLMGSRGPAATVAVTDVAREIEWAKARLVAPAEYASAAARSGRRPPRAAGEVADLYAAYESEKRRRRLIDFDDVLIRCADAIERDEEFAAGQRWRFRHLFVDEFQDATPLQLRLLRGWIGESNDLTVVGDPAQAIYAFTGADASSLLHFEHAFPGGETIALTRNYRSTPDVVAIAEVALGAAAGPARVRPEAIRPSGAAPAFLAHPDDEAEARAVADACWRFHAQGVPWTRMAVLFRTNAQSPQFERAFTRRQVPFRVGEQQRFTARPPVRALLDRLRDAERRFPGRSFEHNLADLAVDDDEPVPETDAGARGGLAEAELRAHRDALFELGRDFLATVGGRGGVGEFTTWLDTATGGASETATGVDLVTFHRAKGLEWSVVFVTGLERGLVPISWAETPDAQAEERRLLHVALSRAEDELHCSWACARSTGARAAAREPSPWLGPLEDEANRAPHGLLGGGRRTPREHLADLRSMLDAAAPPAPPPERAQRLRR